jgi:hypothetical protein
MKWKKGFYVDGHEKLVTLEYRKNSLADTWYMKGGHTGGFNLPEVGAKNWNRIVRLEKTAIIIKMWKVSTLLSTMSGLIQQGMNGLAFGDSLSMRMKDGEQPLIIFRHDEYIYKQYKLTKKTWMLPSRERQHVPKDEGQGVMISMMQLKEFGFGTPLSEEQ